MVQAIRYQRGSFQTDNIQHYKDLETEAVLVWLRNNKEV